ncbi:hypothetical protein AA103196_3095 [Ameyamaea chiangmaiensis NBRC 103196]|uniref:Uncharacterized protein n=1 Tax=Ameyamaea chiangmaiensis TaxID=442969 RepID=A0A850PAI3_9PROT|nr:hypothetical protein [Ameyamaea chiangmaiensis]MBS4074580.1 hypothetical protein [Ameyamaea chiangmaiensis]NVN39336.1 hypothetical protein [Ameyamaea chiangmaiensis]GBQ72556.1 hypothetical protein AA103196_3095 [Ameyamaea chiangmaiensis NBRC 103196]
MRGFLLAAMVLIPAIANAQSRATWNDPTFFSGGAPLSKQEFKAAIGAPGGIPSLDSSGNLTAPVVSSMVRVKGGHDVVTSLTSPPTNVAGLMISDPDMNPYTGVGPMFTYNVDYPNELTLDQRMPGTNGFSLQNEDITGFPAMTFRQHDYYSPLAEMAEHGATGYGASLRMGNDYGYNFFESSNFWKHGNSTLFAAPAYTIQQSGMHFQSGVFQYAYAVLTSGSNKITCQKLTAGADPSGCTFPAGINGQSIYAPYSFGLIMPGTVIASGAGTNTLTLTPPDGYSSASAVTGTSQDTTNGTIVAFGTPVWDQEEEMIFNRLGNVEIYPHGGFANGNYYNAPVLAVDRLFSRVGINIGGPYGQPQADLDINGHGIVGKDSDGYVDRAKYATDGVWNIIASPGSGDTDQTALNIYGHGLNRFHIEWWTNPSLLALRDMNANRTFMTWPMDGSSPVGIDAGVRAPTYYETFITPASSTAACTQGQFGDDANYHYVCTATDTWKRVALATW